MLVPYVNIIIIFIIIIIINNIFIIIIINIFIIIIINITIIASSSPIMLKKIARILYFVKRMVNFNAKQFNVITETNKAYLFKICFKPVQLSLDLSLKNKRINKVDSITFHSPICLSLCHYFAFLLYYFMTLSLF